MNPSPPPIVIITPDMTMAPKPSPLVQTATDIWRMALLDVLERGELIEPRSAGSEWKGRACRELLAYQTRVPISAPVVTDLVRPAPKKFMAAEAAWILSGDNRVSTIAPYARNIKKFSDDGQRFFGAYGPRFVAQLPHVVRTLKADPESRQAVIQVWREAPPDTADCPCTLSWQYVMRDGRLHCLAAMRSSDLISGLPSDWFTFSMAAAAVLLSLRQVSTFWRDIALGDLVLTAGSQHLYRIDFPLAERVIDAAYRDRAHPAVAPLDLDAFDGPDALATRLWALARGDVVKAGFLDDLFDSDHGKADA